MKHVETLGALREQGHRPRSIKDEIRANALRLLARDEPLFPGIVGYEGTVEPELVNALLSRHDILLLGLRGQAKTRLLRGLTRFLDPLTPAIAGSPLHDHPLAPISAWAKRRVHELGDDTPIEWLSPEQRYHEKLATPDVTIADLIGDVDPIKAAHEGLSLDDENVIQYGLVPRSHRGIFAINELPDLAPRIQVGLLNIMEEKDVQIRGFPVRLPVDVLMVFTANPEDYTHRGSIITPLKDRIDSQIQTHYPPELSMAMEITEQEAWTERDQPIHIPGFLRRVIDEVVLLARDSEYVDQSSGVSARASISAYENVISNVERRLAVTPGSAPIARVCDLASIVPALTGKIELAYEGEQEGGAAVARQLVGQALKGVFLEHFPHPEGKGRKARRASAGEMGGGAGPEFDDDPVARGRAARESERDDGSYAEITAFFGAGNKVRLSDVQDDDSYRASMSVVPGLEELVSERMDLEDTEVTAAMELVLEGLYQCSFVAKEDLDRGTLYSDMLLRMFQGLERED